jgi:hypothetical protein
VAILLVPILFLPPAHHSSFDREGAEATAIVLETVLAGTKSALGMLPAETVRLTRVF